MKQKFAILFAALMTMLAAAGCTDSTEKLMTAAQKGDVQAVGAQLAEGTPVDETDPTGSTALLYAAGGGHADLAALLLAKGADVNVRDNEGFMPLHAAVGAGNPDIVRMLVEHGADADAAFRGVDPLQVAERKGNEKIVMMLRAALGIPEPPAEIEASAPPEPDEELATPPDSAEGILTE